MHFSKKPMKTYSVQTNADYLFLSDWINSSKYSRGWLDGQEENLSRIEFIPDKPFKRANFKDISYSFYSSHLAIDNGRNSINDQRFIDLRFY